MFSILFSSYVSGFVEKENTWYLWVVGACVGAFVLLLVTGVVGPYMMWKHRVIVIMKIVHYFQPYEDDGRFLFIPLV